MNKNNLLKKENSHYLLQHADNPVNWYPWGKRAFTDAKKEDKPVFLSIGYSTCHWCHVMARESFEDKEVASLINEIFIPVKVDREERPEINKIYMSVCQIMTGSGGWPLTIFLTPDKKPFFAGTYIPKNSRYGRIGLIELIKKTQRLWNVNREEIVNTAGKITRQLQSKDKPPDEEISNIDILDITYNDLLANYDSQYGGFGYSTKFPTPHKFLFLLHYWFRTKEEKALQMVEDSLKNIYNGGIYDHLGYGFHRYAMDRKWLIPHFEKMLYDQALLAYIYTELYQVTGKEIYAQIFKEIFTYVEERLYSPQGVFYSAEDAESEGEEGKYYLWEEEEIRDVLTDEGKEEFDNIFSLNSISKFTSENEGKYTLSLKDISSRENDMYERIKNKLLSYREKRVRPFIDDKILTDWNALMIAALARAAWVFNNNEYLTIAQKIFAFIEENLLFNNGELYHCYYNDKAAVTANIDDYSFLIRGLIELFMASFDYKYIEIALKLDKYIYENFWDKNNGGYYFSSAGEEDLIIRQKEIYDGAIPSGNSIAFWNLIRLAHITGNMKYLDMSEQLAASFAEEANYSPANFCQYFTGFDALVGPFVEIVIVGNRENDITQEMFKVLRTTYIPNSVIIFFEQEEKVKKGDRFENYKMVNEKTTAYICKNFSCSSPTNKPEEMLNIIKSN